MVIEFCAPPSWGAYAEAFELMQKWQASSLSTRPWLFVEALDNSLWPLHPQGWPTPLRRQLYLKQIHCLHAPSKELPPILSQSLSSGLFEGLILMGWEWPPQQIAQAPLWARRWRLAAKEGDSLMLWVHQKASPAMKADIKAIWSAHKEAIILRGFDKFKEIFSQEPLKKEKEGHDNKKTESQSPTTFNSTAA